jgi:hypothetical protein
LKEGLRSIQVKLDACMTLWLGFTRLALSTSAIAVTLLETMQADESEGDAAPQSSSTYPAGCTPIPPRMKDENVVKHTEASRFIAISLPNEHGVHPGFMLNPAKAVDPTTGHNYTTRWLEHSLLWRWSQENPEQAMAYKELLRCFGTEAIAQITHRYDGNFTDVERLNVETMLCAKDFSAIFYTAPVTDIELKISMREYVKQLAHELGHPCDEDGYDALKLGQCSEFALKVALAYFTGEYQCTDFSKDGCRHCKQEGHIPTPEEAKERSEDSKPGV